MTIAPVAGLFTALGRIRRAEGGESTHRGRMYGISTRIRVTAWNERVVHAPTAVIEVFMAGEHSHAKQVVRRFVKNRPCCVTVTPTEFIYAGGEEAGFVVGIRNYPRFPADINSLRLLANSLARVLRDELGQHSYMTVECGGVTKWSSTRNA